MRRAVRHVHHRERILDARVDLLLFHTVEHERHTHVLRCREKRHQVERLQHVPDPPPPQRRRLGRVHLRHVGPVDQDAPTRGWRETRDQMQHGALP